MEPHIRIPSALSRAFFTSLNFSCAALFVLTMCSFTKNWIPCRRLSSSGVTATRVNMFHTRLSPRSKIASNSIRKCIILFGVSCPMSLKSTAFKTARERVKEEIISATNLARFMDLVSCIDSSCLKWSQRQNCRQQIQKDKQKNIKLMYVNKKKGNSKFETTRPMTTNNYTNEYVNGIASCIRYKLHTFNKEFHCHHIIML